MNELAKIFGVDIKTIKRDIEELKVNKILTREGSLKTGKWKITKPSLNT